MPSTSMLLSNWFEIDDEAGMRGRIAALLSPNFNTLACEQRPLFQPCHREARDVPRLQPTAIP
jgi:hypothetical protein